MEQERGDDRILHVLVLEDNNADAQLSILKLKRAGFELRADVVRKAEEFWLQLESEGYDLILGDYRLPHWTGLEAVRWVRSLQIETPFILVTGMLGDELAIECLKAGADDYVLKENLDRLPVAVKRVLAERKVRAERDRAEAVLRVAEEQYRLLFEANPHPMWVFDTNTLRFLAINNAAIQHYGYSLSEFFAMTVKDIRAPGEVARFFEYADRQKQEGSVEMYSELWKHRKKDGTVIDVEISSQPIKFHGIDAQLVLAHDVTERLKLEQQFRQAQKMEAIGRLAGGVAHDFNNLLMVINGYTQLLGEQFGDQDKAGRYIRQMLQAVQRATGLTKQLLAFSRKQMQELRVLDLSALVTDFCKMLPALVGEDIQMRVQTASRECLIYSDKGQIEQVLMNLVVNARDAMPDGGLLTVETENIDLDGTYFRAHNVEIKPGHYAMLAVTDSGVGMTSDVQNHIFEPFFSTKGPGKGTGLGLSTAYGIVKQNQGYIWVYSEIGKGTTFKVYFPFAATQIEEIEPTAVEEIESRGHETILLVEDEAALRMAACEFLESKGYTVLQAGDGLEALRVSASHEGTVDLLLTDLIMPGFRGTELGMKITEDRPGIEIVYMSGYTELATPEQALRGSAGFLQKPFNLLTLGTTIRRALDKGKASTRLKSASWQSAS